MVVPFSCMQTHKHTHVHTQTLSNEKKTWERNGYTSLYPVVKDPFVLTSKCLDWNKNCIKTQGVYF